jgi:uncharacterized protein YcfJ
MTVAQFVAPILLVPSLALAGTSYDRARVVDVEPLYKSVHYTVPTEQCHLEQVPVYEHSRVGRSYTGPILGAIIGAAIGNAVGHRKHNKRVGTAVGAILGGSIGRDIARRQHYEEGPVGYRSEEVCRVIDEPREELKLTGYRVTYQYAGETHTTKMARDPGKYLRVRVRVSPA